MGSTKKYINSEYQVEVLKSFKGTDLEDLCRAAKATLENKQEGFSLGFEWSSTTPLDKLELYWKGVLAMPRRHLIVGRFDHVIAASIQLIMPPMHKELSQFSGEIENHFVAPWARGHGLASVLLQKAEDLARGLKLTQIRLSVRADQTSAIDLYQACGYKCWGTLECYEVIKGNQVAGRFFYKDLSAHESKGGHKIEIKD